MGAMDATITNRQTFVRIMRTLADQGVTREQLNKMIDDPEIDPAMAKVVEFYREIPKCYNHAACRELTEEVMPDSYDNDGRVSRGGTFPIYDDERDYLVESERMIELLSELTRPELKIVVLRAGLVDGRLHSIDDVAMEMGIKPGQVKYLRGRARRSMRRRAIQLIKARRADAALAV